MAKQLIIIGVFWIASVAADVRATTLVVDPQATERREPNVFTTISQAADVSAAGDTVSVRPGVYRENVQLKHSGTPGAPNIGVHLWLGRRAAPGPEITQLDDGGQVPWPPFDSEGASSGPDDAGRMRNS